MANSDLIRVWVDVNSSIEIDVAPNGSHASVEFSSDGNGAVLHLPAVTVCRLLDRLAPVPNEILVNQRKNGGPLDMCSDTVWSFVRRCIPDASIENREPSFRKAYSAVVYVLVNDVPWRHLPATFDVHPSSAWRRYRDWRSVGLFAYLYKQSCTLGHVPEVIRVHCQEVAYAVRARAEGDDRGCGRDVPECR